MENNQKHLSDDKCSIKEEWAMLRMHLKKMVFYGILFHLIQMSYLLGYGHFLWVILALSILIAIVQYAFGFIERKSIQRKNSKKESLK